MTDTNPNRPRSFWDRIHIDLPLLTGLLLLLMMGAFVMYSASGQDIDMMERKIAQVSLGLLAMFGMAQIPPRVYESWAPYLYIVGVILLVLVDLFG
ncbi:MAG: FtsW/RodA/SpoVE family cell cycle protein, partial [Plesiomonas shigelloides]